MRARRLRTSRMEIVVLPPRAARSVARFHKEFWADHRQWEPYRSAAYFTARVQREILRSESRSHQIVHFWLLAGPDAAALSLPGPEFRGRSILGSLTLSQIVRGPFQSCYLGYKLRPDLYRRGLMSEAVVRVVRFAFDELALHRIEANVMPRNVASHALLTGLGFRDEGIARAYLSIQGRWEDHRHMVLLSTDPPPKKRRPS